MEDWDELWRRRFREFLECGSSPNEGLVAAPTMKERKCHTLTLTWPEELGQCSSIGQIGMLVAYSCDSRPGWPPGEMSRPGCSDFPLGQGHLAGWSVARKSGLEGFSDLGRNDAFPSCTLSKRALAFLIEL